MKLLKAIAISFIISLNSFGQWSLVPSSPSGTINDIVQFNDTIYLSHSNNGVYRSTDGMISWQQVNNGLNTSQSRSVHQILVYNWNLYASTVNGIYKSTNGGNNWLKKSNGITIGPGAIYEFAESIFENNGTLFTGTWNGIYRSTDDAENWIITNISDEGIRAKNFTEHNGILFAARESINDPSGYKSFDNGISWVSLPTNLLLSTITFLSEPPKLWSGTIHGIWLSIDDGINWVNRSNGLAPDPYNSSIIRVNGYLVTSIKFGGSGMFKSSDEGLNWEDFGQGLPFLNTIEKLLVYNDKIIAATGNGLWQRDESQVIPVELISFTASSSNNVVWLNWLTATEANNQGFQIERRKTQDERSEEWINIGFVNGNGTTSQPQEYSYSDDISDIAASKLYYRLKQIDFNGTFEYSDVVEVEIAPSIFSLKQNYPNPFNPSTKISWQSPVSGWQTLKVYDVLGREVVTLVDEYRNAGSYEVEFNPASSIKNPASGIYFYQLKAGGFVQTKKMLLLK